jgi:hypothetical protein
MGSCEIWSGIRKDIADVVESRIAFIFGSLVGNEVIQVFLEVLAIRPIAEHCCHCKSLIIPE